MLATVVKRTPYGNERAGMAGVQSFANRQNITRVGIVILVLVILGGVIFNGIGSRPDQNSETSAIDSCTELRSTEIDRSERILSADLTGTITAAVSELTDLQAERRVKQVERRVKQNERRVKQDELESEEENRTKTEVEADSEKGKAEQAQIDLGEKSEELRAAKEANADEAQLNSLAEEVSILENKVADLRETTTTLDDEIAKQSQTIGSLTETIATLDTEIETLDAEVEVLVRKETALEMTIEAKYFALSAILGENDRNSEIKQARTERDKKNEQLDELQDVLEADRDQQKIDTLSAEIELVELAITSLAVPIWFLDTDPEHDTSGAYFPPRSDVNLVPAIPVSHINLGSHRATSKVEIVLTSASLGDAESVSTAAEDGVVIVAQNVRLPDKAEYFTEAGQFRRSEGSDMPPDQITVWARRVDTVVIMSVCIEPNGLHPGMYAGDVYLVDPSLNLTKVRVEVTAQSQWINLLYLLLFIIPALALAYVWITARYSAGQDPWKPSHWWAWFRQNSVAVLVVGFAAVWATLQVPFNNPTWGSSWLTAAAVIGVGLVAAVTAMTVVAGRVVAEVHSDKPTGNEVEAGTREATEEDA
jgi:hypothetical protein